MTTTATTITAINSNNSNSTSKQSNANSNDTIAVIIKLKIILPKKEKENVITQGIHFPFSTISLHVTPKTSRSSASSVNGLSSPAEHGGRLANDLMSIFFFFLSIFYPVS